MDHLDPKVKLDYLVSLVLQVLVNLDLLDLQDHEEMVDFKDLQVQLVFLGNLVQGVLLGQMDNLDQLGKLVLKGRVVMSD